MKFLFVIFILLLAGCSTTVPYIVEYKISPKIDDTEYAGQECKNLSLKLMQTFSDNSLVSKKMKYVQGKYQELTFTESSWAQSPSKAMNTALLNSLSKSKLFLNVSGYKSRSRSDWVLESSIEEFSQYFENSNQKSFVKIVINMNLVDNKNLKIIASKRISKKIDTLTLDASGGVKALNKALSLTLRETNQWMNGVCK